MKRVFILVICIFILLGNSCKQKEDVKEVTVLIRMMDIQDVWFRENLSREAMDRLNIKLNFLTFNDFEEIEILLRQQEELGEGVIGVVKTPLSVLDSLVAKDYISPLEEIIPEEEVTNFRDEFIDIAMEHGTFSNKTYYIPRKLEVNTFLYLKSELKSALTRFPEYKDEIDQMFKKQNGYGLPVNYTLEENPDTWDWFDLAVVSFIWSRTPDSTGLIWPRMAHRGKDYEGTTVELISKAYQAGTSIKDTLSFKGNGILDLMMWEAFYVENGLYNPKMWEESWSGGGIWNGMKAGEVYGAFMHQLDSFFIHGGTHPAMEGYLKNPDDMAVSLMPKGVSLELDENGVPLRTGDHLSSTNGWWWGIPNSCSDKESALALIQLITSLDFHKSESLTFGMLPVRKDIYESLDSLIDEPWQREVFSTGLEQYNNYGIIAPTHREYTTISSIIREAWFNIIVNKHYTDENSLISRTEIEKNLKEFQERIDNLLVE